MTCCLGKGTSFFFPVLNAVVTGRSAGGKAKSQAFFTFVISGGELWTSHFGPSFPNRTSSRFPFDRNLSDPKSFWTLCYSKSFEGLNHLLRSQWLSELSSSSLKFVTLSFFLDLLCGLVVRVPSYRSRGPGFDSRRYHIFWEVRVWNWVHSASWG
jgi:hypothetical protein